MSFPETFMLCHSFCEVWRRSCMGRTKCFGNLGWGSKMNTFNICKVKKKYNSHGEEPYYLALFSGGNKGITRGKSPLHTFNGTFYIQSWKENGISNKAELLVCFSSLYEPIHHVDFLLGFCLSIFDPVLTGYKPLLKATLSITFHEPM